MKQVLILSFCLMGCNVQTYNSSSADELRYSAIQGDTYYQAASEVLRNKCVSCHQDFTGSPAYFQSQGLIVAGDLANSALFARLRGAGVGGNENMPQVGTLAQAELDAIKNWVLNFVP